MTSSNAKQNESTANQLKLALTELVDAFRKHGAQYALIGGMAVVARGRSRFTRDLDFLLDVSQVVLPKLLDDLAQRGFEFDLKSTLDAWHTGLVVLSWHGNVRVDWLRPVVPGFQHILERATEVELENQPVRVADPEGLILLKLTAWRPQDQEDVRALLLKHSGKLDLDWIRHEFANLSTTDDPVKHEFEALVREFYVT